MRHAKIVATFGPATQGYKTTSELIEAGVNVARLNFSHGDYDVHTSTRHQISTNPWRSLRTCRGQKSG